MHPTTFSNTELRRKRCFFQPFKDQRQEKPEPLQLHHPVERLIMTMSKLDDNPVFPASLHKAFICYQPVGEELGRRKDICTSKAEDWVG